ncbi:butyrate kinase [Desulfocurvus sp. DL9XJH121]
MTHRVLAINPGSTSSKITIFLGEEPVFDKEIRHPQEELAAAGGVAEQIGLRNAALAETLEEAGDAAKGLDAVVGRGGLLAPMPGGTYQITRLMLEDLATARHGEHACNLGAPMALALGERLGIPSFVVDPPVTDEMMDAARLTGLPEIKRRSTFHALSQRGAARTVCKRRGLSYKHSRLLVIHMGGGISLGAHKGGLVVDVINALDGEGPMSPERTGSLPVLEVLGLLEKGAYDIPGLRHAVTRAGGLLAHLGTNNFLEIENRIKAGDKTAKAVFDTLVYNLAKHGSSLMPALVSQDDPGPIDAVVLTGGMARSAMLTDALTDMLGWAGPVELVLGLEEMLALARGAMLVLDGEEEAKEYQG